MAKFTENPILSEKFHSALAHASRIHGKQIRKGDVGAPYVCHLLAVCSLVLESGGDEDEAIAALFHDAVEDMMFHSGLLQGAPLTLESLFFGRMSGEMKNK